MRSRNKLLWLAAVLVAFTSIFVGQAALAVTSTMSLGAGQTMTVNCSSGSSVSWKKTSIGQGNVSCSVPSTTTTLPTTTVPPTTVPTPTTTVPPTTTPPTTTPPTTVPSGSACPQFQTTSNSAAFCDTFASPAGTGNRSGQMNGTVWGVSRATSDNNIGQAVSYDWAQTSENVCGTNQVVKPENDVAVCGGQMIEATNDAGNQTVLAAYPKQPFDFAGRTGTVQFDVSDNTQGPHAAWPSFAITDQPVPAPYDGTLSGVSDTARNSIGVTFDQACNPDWNCGMINNPTCVAVGEIYMTSNYQASSVAFNKDGCVKPSSGPGNNNHVEIQVNNSGVKVYMSNPGDPASLTLVADATFQVPLTRGLIWLEDTHYNAGKFDTQQTNTYSWGNVAFDGPVLPRDLAYDVLDSNSPDGTAENGLPMADLGWLIPSGGGKLNLTIPNVTGSANASGGLLTLNYWPYTAQTLTYSVNGHAAHQMAWPYGSGGTYQGETIGLPVPASDLQDGTNTITLSTSDTGNGVPVANVDLILVGAGGVVSP